MMIADRLENALPRVVLTVAVLLAVILHGIDVAVPAIGMGPLYLLLLGMIAWRLSRRTAIISTIVAVGLNAQSAIHTGLPSTFLISTLRVGLRCGVLAFVVATMWALRRAYDRERASARLDGMTGLLNRSSFEVAMSEILASATAPVIVGVLDLDNFKEINDRYGHAVGDDTIRIAARAAVRGIGGRGFVGRMGGDEFAFVAVIPSDQKSASFATGIHKAISSELGEMRMPATISMGAVLARPGHEYDFNQLLLRADGLLYDAKRTGKNAAVIADTSTSVAVLGELRQKRLVSSIALTDCNTLRAVAV